MFKVGDRVRVVFADPTAASCHKDVVGKTGTITTIKENHPVTLKNIWGEE